MKRRLDVALVERGLAESRTRAQALVMEGKVRVGGQVELKASRSVEDDAAIAVEAPPRFVSRGGEKLEGAFRLWGAEGSRFKVQDSRFKVQGLKSNVQCPRSKEQGQEDEGQRSKVKGQTEEDKIPLSDLSPLTSDLNAEFLPPTNYPLPTTNYPLIAEGKTCLDVGSSTGGFTDCLLQHGAKTVMAVDVGTNQLAYKLRADPRVWVKENYNARYMTRADLPAIPEVAVTDVSFISLKLILPPIAEVLAPGGKIVALIKPQFEVGKGHAPGGLVRDEALRLAARDEIVRFGREELGLELLGLAESPIKGREMGNTEYLSYWRKPAGVA